MGNCCFVNTRVAPLVTDPPCANSTPLQQYNPFHAHYFALPLLLSQISNFKAIFIRPGQSQGLLYKQLCNWLIQSVTNPFPPTASGRRHAQTVRDRTSSYKIDQILVTKNILNPEGHQNHNIGSKVTAILLKGWILPIGGVSSGRVCACSPCSRLATIQPCSRPLLYIAITSNPIIF